MLYDDFMSEDLITAIFHRQSVELDFHQLRPITKELIK